MRRSVISIPVSLSWLNDKKHSACNSFAIPSSAEVVISKYIKSQQTTSALVSIVNTVWQLKWLCSILRSYETIQWAIRNTTLGDGLSKLMTSSEEVKYPIWGCKKEIWNLAHNLHKFIFALNKQSSFCCRNEGMKFNEYSLKGKFRKVLERNSWKIHTFPRNIWLPLNNKKDALWFSPDR